MRSIFYLALLGVALGTIALITRSGILARKDPGRPINVAMREALAAQKPQFSTEDAKVVDEMYGNAHKLPSGLRFVLRRTGTGTAMPTIGDEVTIHYSARLLDGTEFDSSYRTGIPKTYRLGSGQGIQGWDEAFGFMKKGEKRTLVVPYWLAYGEKGRPPTIPPKATVIFDVELLDWR